MSLATLFQSRLGSFPAAVGFINFAYAASSGSIFPLGPPRSTTQILHKQVHPSCTRTQTQHLSLDLGESTLNSQSERLCGGEKRLDNIISDVCGQIYKSCTRLPIVHMTSQEKVIQLCKLIEMDVQYIKTILIIKL